MRPVGVQESPVLYWLYALSPVHVGTGQGVGFVDLPIAREKVTGWPAGTGACGTRSPCRRKRCCQGSSGLNRNATRKPSPTPDPACSAVNTTCSWAARRRPARASAACASRR